MAYVYRHIRLDKNEPFYIGVGLTYSGGKNRYYERAYTKHARNQYWHNIVNKTDYVVEIMLDDLTDEEARIKEKEFIFLYGRKDLGHGTLVNMTSGGDGGINFVWTDEMRAKRRNSQMGKKWTDSQRTKITNYLKSNHPLLGKKMSLETRMKMSRSKKGLQKGEKHPFYKRDRNTNPLCKKVKCIKTNKIWASVKDCCDELGLKYSTTVGKLNGRKKNNTSLKYI